MEKAKVTTWKMAPNRYLHQVEVERGYFHLVTDSSFFSTSSFTLRNKVLVKRSIKETQGLKKIREEQKEWLNEDSWTILCFGGCDNIELRKKIYGRELSKVVIKLEMYNGGRIDGIYARKENDSEFSDNLIKGHSVRLLRNLRKRVRNPLPYIVSQYMKVWDGEAIKLYIFTVPEVSYVLFLRKLKEWGWTNY